MLHARRRSLIATRSSSVNPVGFFPVAVLILGDFCVLFFAAFIVLSFQKGYQRCAGLRTQRESLPAAQPHCVVPTTRPMSRPANRLPAAAVPGVSAFEDGSLDSRISPVCRIIPVDRQVGLEFSNVFLKMEA